MAKLQNFILFCLVGGTSALIDMSLLYASVEFFNIPLLLAATLSFSVASINGYVLNQKFTFKNEKNVSFSQYLMFLTVSLAGLGLTLALLHMLTNIVGLHYLIAKIITIAIVVFWNYFANTLWTFKKS